MHCLTNNLLVNIKGDRVFEVPLLLWSQRRGLWLMNETRKTLFKRTNQIRIFELHLLLLTGNDKKCYRMMGPVDFKVANSVVMRENLFLEQNQRAVNFHTDLQGSRRVDKGTNRLRINWCN